MNILFSVLAVCPEENMLEMMQVVNRIGFSCIQAFDPPLPLVVRAVHILETDAGHRLAGQVSRFWHNGR